MILGHSYILLDIMGLDIMGLDLHSGTNIDPLRVWDVQIPQPINCFQKQRVGYRVWQGYVSRNTSRNVHGRVCGARYG